MPSFILFLKILVELFTDKRDEKEREEEEKKEEEGWEERCVVSKVCRKSVVSDTTTAPLGKRLCFLADILMDA